MPDEYLLKICVLCCPDELLTQSLRSYADGGMEPSYRFTLGFTVPIKTIKIDNNSIKLILFDISTGPTNPNLFRGASGAVFAFSKGNHSFVRSAIEHYHEFRQHIPESAIAFVGLHDDSEVVTQAEGQSLAQELGVDYFEMAIDDLQTLDAVVRSLVQKVLIHKGQSV